MEYLKKVINNGKTFIIDTVTGIAKPVVIETEKASK